MDLDNRPETRRTLQDARADFVKMVQNSETPRAEPPAPSGAKEQNVFFGDDDFSKDIVEAEETGYIDI